MMAEIYAFEGLVPVVDTSAYVHPTAVLIGDVIVGPRCYVGPHAVLRGDFGRLILEEGSNLQDTCIMHGFPKSDTVVEVDGHVGHGAVLHGCRVGRNAMIGMNAVIMDNAVIGEASIVAALAFVKANMSIPARRLVAGIPGKIVRELTDEEIAWKSAGTAAYQQLTYRSLASLRPTAPLTALEPGRPQLPVVDGIEPLFQTRHLSQRSNSQR